MFSLASFLGGPEVMGIIGGTIGFTVLFTYLSIVTFMSQRRKERDNFYRFELRKKALESGAPAQLLLEMQQREEQIYRRRRRDGHRLGGLITAGVGLGLLCVMVIQRDMEGVGMAFLPLFIGLALYGYAQWLAPRGDEPEGKGGDEPKA